MANSTLGDEIRKLAQDNNKRSKAARFRDIYNEVEAAIKAGVSIETIHETARNNGLDLTLESFKTNLYRTRRAIGKGKLKKEYVAPEPASDDEKQSTTRPTSDPAELDRIISSKPNLDELAKHAKKGKGRQP